MAGPHPRFDCFFRFGIVGNTNQQLRLMGIVLPELRQI